MFLYDLNPSEQQAFLQIAYDFIALDGVIRPEEERLLQQFAREMNAQESSIQPAMLSQEQLYELLSLFVSKQSQISLLLELIGLGYVDQEFHSSESERVQEIAAFFGFLPEQVQQYEIWVLQQINHFNEAQMFWLD